MFLTLNAIDPCQNPSGGKNSRDIYMQPRRPLHSQCHAGRKRGGIALSGFTSHCRAAVMTGFGHGVETSTQTTGTERRAPDTSPRVRSPLTFCSGAAKVRVGETRPLQPVALGSGVSACRRMALDSYTVNENQLSVDERLTCKLLLITL